jgi:uncharacterized membrane protein YuzA (DUF378 family)
MKLLHIVTFLLVVVGAINWGLTALNYNVVHMILGSWPQVEMIVYLLVGVSGVYVVFDHMKTCNKCKGMSGGVA